MIRSRYASVLIRANPWAVLIFVLLFSIFASPFPLSAQSTPTVKPGIETLCDKYASQLSGKRVGLLTNPTGIDLSGVSTIDRVAAIPGVKLVRLFAPEHGLRGGQKAGENIDDSKDAKTGLPIVSLYGSTRRPPPESLNDLDIVLYDIQDIGSRSYTFVSSLTYLMEACEKAGVAVWVLDRPDPMGGDKVGGPLLTPDLISFVGIHSVTQTYGMTPGEWAKMIQIERTPKLKLTVIPMEGWKRGMLYGELGWPWVPPSEHIPRWETSLFYAMTGTFGELGTISEGVGTPLPFEQVGAPWIDGAQLAAALNALDLKGVWFRATAFKPRYATYSGQPCSGVQIHLRDARACDPAAIGLAIMETLQKLYPARNLFKSHEGDQYQMFERALGDASIATMLSEGRSAAIQAEIQKEKNEFLIRREKALIYR